MSDFGGSSITPETPPSKEERTLALIAHLLGLIGVLSAFFGFVGPLAIYLVKKDESPFVAQNALQALAFNIAMAIVAVVLLVIAVVTCGLGGLLFIPYMMVYLLFVIVGAVRANDGVVYCYPVSSSFVK
jgi:uncharacterized Tic20 family protein